MSRSRLSFLSSLLLSASLLTSACGASAVRSAGDAGVAPAPAVAVAPSIDRAAVRAALAARREASVERFLAYREARVYPLNSFADGLQHVWLDALGNLCAAATIIAADWGRDAVAAVAREDNFVRLADVHDGPLADWILTSGLTHHEVVAIQEPMMYEPEPTPGPDVRAPELARLHAIYTSVERQLRTLWDENLDLATDALLARPDLARALLDGHVAAAGRFAVGPVPAA
jgi:hypothetical protein